MTVTVLTPRVTIGGSSAAAACGIDPFRSRIMLWLELTGRVQREENEAMRWGTLLQPIIFAELAERGYEVEPADDPLFDARQPWRVGHLDGYALDDDSDRWGVLEIKTAGTWAWQGDDPPLAYVAQVQHYLSLTELDFGLLAVLVAGQKLHVHTINRDEHAIALLLRLESEFMGYVQRDTPPPVDGSSSAREALGLLYPEAVARTVRLTGEAWEWRKALAARKEQAKAIDEQITELENRLKQVMGEAEHAVSPFETPALRWTNVPTTRLDMARLKAERPDICAEYSATTSTRRFSLA